MKIRASHSHRVSVGLVILAVLLVLSASTTATAQKSLYVNADLNGYSPIRAYGIQPSPTYLAYQDVSNTTEYGGVGLAIDTDSATLFVTFEFAGYLRIVDATTLNVPSTSVTAPGASDLAGIVVDQELALVYTVDRWTDNLYVYIWNATTSTLTLAGQYDLPGIAGGYGNGAVGLALDEINDILYVTLGSTTVNYYSTSDFNTLAGTISVGNVAIGVAVDAENGYLYTGAAWSSYYYDHFSQYDLGASTETVINFGYGIGVMGIAVDTDTDLVYVTTGYGEDAIRVYDSSMSLLYQTGLIGNPTGIVVPGVAISYNPLKFTKDDGLAEGGCMPAGSTFTYELCYDNLLNTYDVDNVWIVDTLPPEVDYVSATGSPTYVYGDHEVIWDIGTLAAGAPQQCVYVDVMMNASAAPGASITNNATITSDDTGDAFGLEETEVCPNSPPEAFPDFDDVTVDEGQTATNDGTVSDPDGDTVTLSASVGTVVNNGDGTWSWSFLTTNGPSESGTVTITADDGQGGTAQATFNLMVYNVAPSVGPITVDLPVVEVNTAILASSPFTDPGTGDFHVAGWDWDDTSASAGTVTQGAGFGSVDDTHTYTAAGVYEIALTVTDSDGASGQAFYQYVVVYDPGAGFVTGGGWIDSQPGAYIPDPALTGKANFGFVSKYKKGASTPTGNTEFQFHAASLNFHSSSYQWLVVTGSDYARFKGEGTINGMGAYKFLIWAGDDTPDTFRIKIWEEDEDENETVIYDNGFDQEIGAGSIVIHTKK